MAAPRDRPEPAPASPRLGPASVALVSGAGSGIGQAVAVGLARAGLAVGLLGRHAGRLAGTADACREAGARVLEVTADVTQAVQVRAAVSAVDAQLGPVDLLVSNAGLIDAETPFAEADVDDVWEVVSVNLRGPLVLAHALLPGMLARGGGRIVHVNSGFASRREPVYTGYPISKAALARFTVTLDTQYGAAGLVVLDVSPGLVRTAMTEAMPMWRERGSPYGPVQPMVDTVVRAARGDLDPLHGRFLHAQADDLDDLLARAAELAAADARVLRLARYGPDDPVA